MLYEMAIKVRRDIQLGHVFLYDTGTRAYAVWKSMFL